MLYVYVCVWLGNAGENDLNCEKKGKINEMKKWKSSKKKKKKSFFVKFCKKVFWKNAYFQILFLLFFLKAKMATDDIWEFSAPGWYDFKGPDWVPPEDGYFGEYLLDIHLFLHIVFFFVR